MVKSKVLRVLGIDPGTAITGWGIMDFESRQRKVIAYGVVRTEANSPMPMRLSKLHKELNEIIGEFCPVVAAIEDLFFFKNAKTVITVGQARGVAILSCVNSGLEVYEYTPLQVKQTVTGYGRAEKKQMQEMVRMLLNLKEIPKPDDAADAIAVAYTHSVFQETINNS